MSTSKRERNLIRKRSTNQRPGEDRERRVRPYVKEEVPSVRDAMEEFTQDYVEE